MHMMVAAATKIDEIRLSPDESKQLAAALAEVNSHYNVVMDPKVIAWVGLTTTAASIYGPRIAAYKIRTTMENKRRKEQEKTVVQKVEAPQPGLQPAAEVLPISPGVPV